MMAKRDVTASELAALPAHVQRYIERLVEENVGLQERVLALESERCNTQALLTLIFITWFQQTKNLQHMLSDYEQRCISLVLMLQAFRLAQFGSISECTRYLPTDDAANDTASDNRALVAVKGHTRRAPESHNPGGLLLKRVIENEKALTVCWDCGGERQVIAWQPRRTYHYIRAYIEERITYQATTVCMNAECGCPIHKPKASNASLFPKSPFDASVMAQVIVEKCLSRTPLYHQEKVSALRSGENSPLISRQTMSRLFIKTSESSQPLWNLMAEQLSEHDIGWMDATSLQVLKEPGRAPQTKSKAWSFIGGPPAREVLIFEYAAKEHKKVIARRWEGFQGCIHSDADRLFEDLWKIAGIAPSHCNAHARRPFAKLAKLTKHHGVAYHVVEVYRQIYAIEAHLKPLSISARQALREEQIRPKMARLLATLQEDINKVPKKTILYNAMAYYIRHYERLTCFILDGRLMPDNNDCEQIIKYLVMARKQFLFCDTVAGARALCNHMSLVFTAMRHGLDPYMYCHFVLTRLPSCRTLEDYEQLLPWRAKVSIEYMLFVRKVA